MIELPGTMEAGVASARMWPRRTGVMTARGRRQSLPAGIFCGLNFPRFAGGQRPMGFTAVPHAGRFDWVMGSCTRVRAVSASAPPQVGAVRSA